MARHAEAGGLRLDNECSDAIPAARSVDGGEDDRHLRLLAVGDPDLAAGERVALIGPFGKQREGGGVRPGARLGQGERAEMAPRRHRRQEAVLLLIGAKSQDGQLRQDVDREADGHPHIRSSDLLARQDPGERAHSRAAVLLGIRKPGEAQRRHALEE